MLLRTELKDNLRDYIGDYSHSENSFPIPLGSNEDELKRISPTHLNLDRSNNLFDDLEVVQRSMVKYYNITTEGMPLDY